MQHSKRFYSEVSVVSKHDTYQIMLDGKAVKNGSIVLQHTSKPLMDFIAGEWEAQKNAINFLTMPYTRLLFSVLMMDDSIRVQHQEVIMQYACNDTLCYHAPHETPLAEKQLPLWGEWLDWAREFFGAEFLITHDIMPLEQPADTQIRIKEWLDLQDNTTILMLYLLTDALKSFIIAVALVQNCITVTEAMNVVWLEHDEQSLQWGTDAEYTQKRQASQQLAESTCQFYYLAH